MSLVVALLKLAINLQFITALTVCLIGYCVYKWINLKKNYSHIEQMPSKPIFGHVFDFIGYPFHDDGLKIYQRTRRILLQCSEKFKSGCTVLWIFNKPLVILFKAEHAEKILTSTEEITKGADYDMMRVWLYNGLLLSTGKVWKARRKMISPAFHFSILNDFIPIFVENGKELAQNMLEIQNEHGIIPDLMKPIEKCALEVICQTSMGVKVEQINENKMEGVVFNYSATLAFFSQKLFERAFLPLMENDWLYFKTSDGKKVLKAVNFLSKMLDKIIEERIQQRSALMSENKNTNNNENVYFYGKLKRKLAFMDLLVDTLLKQREEPDLPEEQKLTIENIREEVNTFTFEGYDTTSTTLMSTIYLLGLHPEAQQKAYEEIIEVLGTGDDGFTLENISKLKYLEACIKESLRLIQTVPMISRTLQKDFVLDEHLVIPAQTVIYVSIMCLALSDKYFDQPKVFRPERFFNQTETVNFAYIPFSAGPRNCIGQRFAMTDMKVIIANILRTYQIESLLPFDKFEHRIEVITKPGVPVPVRIQVRDH